MQFLVRRSIFGTVFAEWGRCRGNDLLQLLMRAPLRVAANDPRIARRCDLGRGSFIRTRRRFAGSSAKLDAGTGELPQDQRTAEKLMERMPFGVGLGRGQVTDRYLGPSSDPARDREDACDIRG